MVSLYFPDKTIGKMAGLGISEADVYDVFNHGEEKISGRTRVMVKKYNGFEIGLYFDTCKRAGDDYTIITVWKRDRR